MGFDPRGPNKAEPGIKAPHPQYPAPPGETEYGTHQDPNKKKNHDDNDGGDGD